MRAETLAGVELCWAQQTCAKKGLEAQLNPDNSPKKLAKT